jgi:transcription elongation factor GreA
MPEHIKKKLQEETNALEHELNHELPKELKKAVALGDLSENAEYHAAREDQGLLQAQIDLLRTKLAKAYIIDPKQLPKDTVVFGSKVKVKDLDMDEEEEFTLVGPGQDNPDQNRILTTSPIGQGLLGKKRGEVAEIQVPRGVIRFKVLEIAFAQ